MGRAPRRPPFRQIEGDWYVRSDVVASLTQKHSLVDGRAFAVLDVLGDVPAQPTGELGFYWRGTRHLSTLEIQLGGRRPLLLASELSSDERRVEIEKTNGDLRGADGRVAVPRDAIHCLRRVTLEGERLFVELSFTNHHHEPVELELSIDVDADFADLFEVRGTVRAHRGHSRPPQVRPEGVVLAYVGLDRTPRFTEVVLDPPPDEVVAGRELHVHLRLDPGAHRRFVLRARPGHGEPDGVPPPTFPGREAHGPRSARRWRTESPSFRSSDPRLEQALERAVADLGLMHTETEDGPFPYAGIPWYATPFGRDAITVGLQLLPWRPDVAASILRFLARRRARAADDFTDAEPGKVLHELREGEMAALREIPFVPYYGTADATPLWLCLLGELHAVSGDDAVVRELWDGAEDALAWIEGPGDPDRDGLVEYERRSPSGLKNQGWKDSWDSVHHASGEIAEGPIALVEVQAYAYAARTAFATLLEKVHGQHERAHALRVRAEELRARFEERFWDEELGTYVIALDGEKRPCRVPSSNAGHVLWAGAAQPWRAKRVADRLFHPDLFSGFGVRTLASGTRRYNPMSYHNGSVWPHDNAIAAEGLRRYGHPDRAAQILRALADAAAAFPLARMPELFCGFPRREGRGPVPYPVACSPQAWASGALLHAVRVSLGLGIDARAGRLVFEDPRLPEGVAWIEIFGIRVGDGTRCDVRVRRGARYAAVEVLDKQGDIELVIRKTEPPSRERAA